MATTTGPGRQRTPGKHRRPGRACRAGARIAGVAGLATASVAGSLAAPAAAAPATPAVAAEEASGRPDTGLTQAAAVSDSLAGRIADQARTQRSAAEAAAEEAARKAAARAEREREEGERRRAARAAERAALHRYVAPVAGSHVSTAYGAGGAMWSSGSHTGVDFHAASGTTVRSVAAGEVVEAGWSGAYGYNVVVRHADGTYTQYGHLSSVTVASGARVGAGDRVGLSGSTGNSSGPHLHFEVRTGPDYGSDIAPLPYLREHGVDV
ncbi:M23 family metallopeptidase [Streptomyces sp. DSM 42041]|uniref:M23 family metallopeptidase n=1 Tax=Streptomyces hazeniae TaxID=3075538 RepID=A0ABU2NN18_9ACTN|nr:M23 family metallopeptidase [Streptomyces sp. DSM 42041]MDT0378380.1 M23 family metallopeptidase [Streptomyces sp. DSM 42041]